MDVAPEIEHMTSIEEPLKNRIRFYHNSTSSPSFTSPIPARDSALPEGCWRSYDVGAMLIPELFLPRTLYDDTERAPGHGACGFPGLEPLRRRRGASRRRRSFGLSSRLRRVGAPGWTAAFGRLADGRRPDGAGRARPARGQVALRIEG